MSKMDNLRALREARYEQEAARGATSSATRRTPRPAATPAAPKAAATATTGAEGLCGHKSMNGRSCTREQGHAAKSHRYS